MSAAQFEEQMSAAQRLHQSERTACRVIDGKAVVITIDQSELHVLNSVGTRVWELSDGRAMRSVVDQIVEEFEVTRLCAVEDVVAFARKMLAVGALEVRSGEGQ